MATHKKTPIFLRIITNDKAVVCINPLELSSFQILVGAKVQTKGDKRAPQDGDFELLDQIRFFFPSGTGLTYTVGKEITQEEFNYICSTLQEFLYLNEAEFKAKTEAIKKAQFDDWNKISEENSQKHNETPAETK